MADPLVVFCAYDNPGSVSGPNVWLRRLLPELREAGLRVEAWFFSLDSSDSPTADSLNQQNVRTRSYPFKSSSRSKIRWLLQQAVSEPPAVFIPNLSVPAFHASRWLRAADIPVVGILHSDDDFYHAIAREFSGRTSDWRVSDLVCVSQQLRSEMESKVDPSVNLHTIPYGAPVPGAKAKYESKSLDLVYVGRLVQEQKQILDVVQALCRAALEVPGVTARILGDGPAKSDIKRIIIDRGCENAVKLEGRIESDLVQEEMLRSQVLVLLSEYEGLPIALMEGMACGLVPICTRIRSGIPELVRHERNGLLVDDRGDGFVAAVRALRESPDTWESLSAAARSTIERDYSIDRCVLQWEELLQSHAQHVVERSRPQFPKRIDLPDLQPEFAREDFRIHHLLARAVNRIRRLSQSG